MKSKVEVLRYDAFTDRPGMGNPAGIVLDGEGYTEEEMVAIAAAVGFNETTFVQKPRQGGDLRLRYYTPGHEMDLCGHATVATLTALAERGLLPGPAAQGGAGGHGRDDGAVSGGELAGAVRGAAAPAARVVRVETRAGLLPVTLAEDGRVTMQQAPARFLPFGGDRAALASSMGLAPEDLDPELPIMYGSTGIWTLLVPIRGLEPFSRMKPDNARFPELLQEQPRASLHPFTLETADPACRMHARHFSSPYSGTVEDPVTGTASGVMGAYSLTFLEPEKEETIFTVEQGLELGKDGKVGVHAVRKAGIIEVAITGTAVFAEAFHTAYEKGERP